MVYRKGEGIIANINRPTFDVYEVSDEGLTLLELLTSGPKETYIGREGPELKEEENWTGSSEAEHGPVKA